MHSHSPGAPAGGSTASTSSARMLRTCIKLLVLVSSYLKMRATHNLLCSTSDWGSCPFPALKAFQAAWPISLQVCLPCFHCRSTASPWCNLGFTNKTIDTLPKASPSQPSAAPPSFPESPIFEPPTSPVSPTSATHTISVILGAVCSLEPNLLYLLPTAAILTGPGTVDFRYFTSRWSIPSGDKFISRECSCPCNNTKWCCAVANRNPVQRTFLPCVCETSTLLTPSKLACSS